MIQLELQFVGLTKRHCPVCGGEVVGRPNKVYCSNRCKKKAYRQANPERYKDQQKAYRQANRERLNARHKAYWKANRERLNAHKKAYRQANRERLNAKQKVYYQANREKLSAKQKVYSQTNREQRKAYYKAHYHANRERYLERVKAYHQSNRERRKALATRRRARKKANGVEPTHEHRNTMVNPLTRQVCHYCGTDCTGHHHWDHHIPISKGGPEAPWNLVVSCPTCNLSKSDRLPESMFCDELGLVT